MANLLVTKRDGRKESVCLDKIRSRIVNLCHGLDINFIEPEAVSQKVLAGLFPGVSSVQIEDLIAEIAASMTVKHPDYSILAARVAITKLHKETEDKFSNVIEKLYSMEGAEKQFTTDTAISDHFYALVKRNADRLDAAIKHERDFDYNYFGFKTLEKSYLLQVDKKIVERPQHMLMRVALGIHGEDLDAAEETYELLSERWFTHASPTLFNAGTTKCQLSSCFLVEMKEDSIEGIYDTLKQCASISKNSGGIGLSVHNIRAKGTRIAGTNGTSDGLIPMLRVFNNTARHVNQGGRRPGSFAIYLEPWHADIFDFIDMKKNTGAEEVRARDLFYALWIPDLFMKRVEQDQDWSLMCPHECPGLHTSYGHQFEQLYQKYEAEGKFKRQVKARQLWFHIVNCQIETGTPYMMYKDACNSKSNQQNLGTIKSSNLCTEIVQYTSKDEIAKLRQVAKVVTRNLNKIIDINHYPLQEARNSNTRHRPIGIGVQGLADAFILMRYPFDSAEARKLNRDIFENIYYAACEASCELSELYGPYSSFAGSPTSKGMLQFDLWKLDPKDLCLGDCWASLKNRIVEKGMRNSLLIAPMPTASTAQILGNNESTEPFTSNMYVRRVLSGEFQVVNQHLLRDLTNLKLWNEQTRMRLLRDYGSVQHIDEIPDELKALYRTVWEIPQKSIVLMAAERGPFIDQSQSMNIHLAKPSASAITSMHFYGWKAGLKTGTYYLRTQPAANPIQVTIDKSKLKVQKSTATNTTTTTTTKTTTRDDNTSSSSSGDERATPDDDGLGSSENSSLDGEAIKMCSIANGPSCEMCSG